MNKTSQTWYAKGEYVRGNVVEHQGKLYKYNAALPSGNSIPGQSPMKWDELKHMGEPGAK